MKSSKGILSSKLVVTAAAGVLALLLVCVAFILAPQSTVAQQSGCVLDTQGPDDEPGQKDLNELCVDYSGLPDTIDVSWNWDEIGWSGNNTGDACSLYDIDDIGDPGYGLADYSLCTYVGGEPAQYLSHTLYSCGDGRPDRCTNPRSEIPNTSVCGASIEADVFGSANRKDKGDTIVSDTVGSCLVEIVDFQDAEPTLLDVCSYPSGIPGSDPSDCVVFGPPILEVRKILDPPDDSGLFNLLIDGSVEFPDATQGDTTGPVPVSAGTHTASETGGTGTDLADYGTTYSCTVNGAPWGSGTGSSVDVPVDNEEHVVCTFYNELNLGTLRVIKEVINDNDGTAAPSAFSLHVKSQGIDVPGSPAPGSETGTVYTLLPGDYVVSEDLPPAGYVQTGLSGDCDSAGNVTVVPGVEKTCTVTNDDIQPQVIVIKHVINDNGGTAVAGSFTMSVTGNGPSPASFPGAESPGTTVSLNAGSYSVSETGPAGYADTYSDDCSGSIAVGETKTCTVTNDDIQPQLIVIKQIEGGTAVPGDFTISVSGTNVEPDSFAGEDSPGTTVSLDAGSYSVSETDGPQGYDAFYSDDCSGSIVVGETRTCTVTNDVLPDITVTKWPFPAIRPQPGGQYVFTVRVHNETLEPVELTSLVDDIYGDLNGKGDCSLPHDIGGGGFYECSFSVLFTGDPKTQTDTVIAEAQDDEGNTASDDDDATISITFGGLLDGIEVTKTADPIFLPEPGGPVTFTVRVANGSPVDVTLTWLGDDIHGDLQGQGTCEVPQTIPAGDFYQCSFTADVQYYLAGESETDTVAAVAHDDQGLGAYATGSATVNIIPTGVTPYRVYVPLVMNNW